MTAAWQRSHAATIQSLGKVKRISAQELLCIERRGRQAFATLHWVMQGMREELEDGAAALEGMTSAGLDGLHRMFANLQAVELAKDVFC